MKKITEKEWRDAFRQAADICPMLEKLGPEDLAAVAIFAFARLAQVKRVERRELLLCWLAMEDLVPVVQEQVHEYLRKEAAK